MQGRGFDTKMPWGESRVGRMGGVLQYALDVLEGDDDLERTSRGICVRSGSSLTCVVVVLDETGKPQDAIVSYPSRLGLTDQEKQMILSVQWTPAQLGGQTRPSLVSMDFEVR